MNLLLVMLLLLLLLLYNVIIIRHIAYNCIQRFKIRDFIDHILGHRHFLVHTYRCIHAYNKTRMWNFFWHNLERSFHIWGQIGAVFDNPKF